MFSSFLTASRTGLRLIAIWRAIEASTILAPGRRRPSTIAARSMSYASSESGRNVCTGWTIPTFFTG
jgi:hypothetical protein